MAVVGKSSSKKPIKRRRNTPAGKGLHVKQAAATRSNSSDDDETTILNIGEKQARDDIRLSFLIHDVSRMRRAAYDQFMKPLGITRAQWWVLANLSRHDGMMQTQLADVLEVGKASLGDLIGTLEFGGWVERRPDPSDKRVKRIFLTRLAQSLIKRMTAMEVRFNNRLFGELSIVQRADLFKMLLTIKRAIPRGASAGEGAKECEEALPD